MIKGPKAILSSAIANALAEYFIVNPSQIESNLLSDANITLHNVQLKSTVTTITAINSYGGSTVLTTSGCVDKVTFSWEWSVSRDVSATAEWIKNAVLVIEGVKFVCRLEHRDAASERSERAISKDDATAADNEGRRRSSFVNPSTIDDKTAKEIKVTPGGISGFVQRQIEHVIDNLTLRMVDFELKIEIVMMMMMDSSSSSAAALPSSSSSVVKSDGAAGGGTTTSRSFVIAIDEVELLSYGRQQQQPSSSSSSSPSSSSLLKQRVNLRSFRSSISINNTGSSVTKRDEDTVANQDNNIDVNSFINEFAFLPADKHSNNNNNEEGVGRNVDSDREGSSSTIEEKVYHLIEPFTYSADVTRVGSKRFSGLMTGLDVVGIAPSSKEEEDGSGSDSGDGGGIALHMGKIQVESLMLLGELILAPPSAPGEIGESVATTDNAKDSTTEHSSQFGVADNETGTDITEAAREKAIETTATIDENEPSSFTVPLSFATLVVDDKKFSVSGIYTKYKADGTICQFDARKVSYESSDGGLAEASQIHVSMRPTMKMIVDSIDTLYVPDVMQLTKPIEFIELKYEGKALTVRFQDIEVITFGKGQDTTSSTIATTKESSPAKSSSTKTQSGSPKAGRQKQEQAVMITAPKLPFSLDVSVKKCDIKKSADGSSMQMSNLQLFCNENDAGNSSDVALRFDHFKNHLASISDVNMCASLPYDAVNCINALNLSIGDATIVSGHSVEDWQESFQPKYQSKTAKSSKTNEAPSAVIKLPNANIAAIQLTITYAADVGVKVKQTKFIAKAFTGKEATTSKDIINYYTLACLAKAPEFISNAEVLGLNVLDSTASTWGNFLGLATPFGAVTGVAAVVGVDAVKNAVNAGKRGRGVSENDDYEASDIARGLFQAAKEATVRGAEMRGKKDNEGNVIDWAVGATTTTGEYVGENKTRLGGAAGGAGGFWVGMAVGGPVGAIIGGLAATAVTGKTLKTIDEYQKKDKIEQPKLAE